MDKTIEIILVAAVTMVAAIILMVMLQGESGDVTSTFDNLISGNECDSKRSQWKTAKDNGNDRKAQRLRLEAQDIDGCNPGTWGSSSGSGSSPPGGAGPGGSGIIR